MSVNSLPNIRAMVMAAGAGTRLRPLTDHVPKPMVPIANRPVLEYTIENLKRHGITQIILNLHNHPDQIRNHFKDGEAWGVQLTYSHETKLLGTAGGVRKMAPILAQGICLVMSGDGLTDIDLTQLLEFHRRKKSVATMALKAVHSKFDYGVTLTNKEGRIQRFYEKPSWGDVFSNHVNTGIYVLEPKTLKAISTRIGTDFGHDVWPALLRKKAAIFAQVTSRYWCDVGNVREYDRAQRDMLEGHTRFRLPGREIRRGVWAEEGVRIHRTAKIQGPCLIGRSTILGEGAELGPHTVIGADCRIADHTTLRYTTLWDRVQVGARAHLEGCIVVNDAVVHPKEHLFGAVCQTR